MKPFDKARSLQKKHFSAVKEKLHPSEWDTPVNITALTRWSVSWDRVAGFLLSNRWAEDSSTGDQVWMGLGVLTIVINTAVGGWGIWIWTQKWIDHPSKLLLEIFL